MFKRNFHCLIAFVIHHIVEVILLSLCPCIGICVHPRIKCFSCFAIIRTHTELRAYQSKPNKTNGKYYIQAPCHCLRPFSIHRRKHVRLFPVKIKLNNSIIEMHIKNPSLHDTNSQERGENAFHTQQDAFANSLLYDFNILRTRRVSRFYLRTRQPD